VPDIQDAASEHRGPLCLALSHVAAFHLRQHPVILAHMSRQGQEEETLRYVLKAAEDATGCAIAVGLSSGEYAKLLCVDGASIALRVSE